MRKWPTYMQWLGIYDNALMPLKENLLNNSRILPTMEKGASQPTHHSGPTTKLDSSLMGNHPILSKYLTTNRRCTPFPVPHPPSFGTAPFLYHIPTRCIPPTMEKSTSPLNARSGSNVQTKSTITVHTVRVSRHLTSNLPTTQLPVPQPKKLNGIGCNPARLEFDSR